MPGNDRFEFRERARESVLCTRRTCIAWLIVLLVVIVLGIAFVIWMSKCGASDSGSAFLIGALCTTLAISAVYAGIIWWNTPTRATADVVADAASERVRALVASGMTEEQFRLVTAPLPPGCSLVHTAWRRN